METDYIITKLDPIDFKKCCNIWDIDKHADLAEKFCQELLSGNRITYILQINEEYIGEISLVFDMNDKDYTVKGQRIYLSRLIVKKEYRRKGLGKELVKFAVRLAKDMGYSELSVGVDLDNFAALKLYFEAGFNTLLYIGEDKGGKYAKLLMRVNQQN
ncbi:MAG: GNAT family N-acetyltransferase [Oscillospiraceae bacterium]|nr:GNAT family N-acetyltransferase [Oscillospiraceae bacterium]